MGGKARPGARHRAVALALALAQADQCRIHGEMPPV
jgi:hypothetical protein